MTIEKLEKYNIFKENIISLDLLENQGFNNISYLLKTSANKYILRVFKSNESVNISRNFEYEILKKLYKLNITSKPIFINEEFMIYEFIKGTHKTKLSSNEIKIFANQIKKFHKIKIKTKPYDIKNDLKKYDLFLNDFKSKKILRESIRTINAINKFKKELVLTHHDLNYKNIIFNNSYMKIIDWEYAGTNDRFFDLASFSIEFNLNMNQEKTLLMNYFDGYCIKKEQKLHLYKRIYKNLCNLWFYKFNKINKMYK